MSEKDVEECTPIAWQLDAYKMKFQMMTEDRDFWAKKCEEGGPAMTKLKAENDLLRASLGEEKAKNERLTKLAAGRKRGGGRPNEAG